MITSLSVSQLKEYIGTRMNENRQKRVSGRVATYRPIRNADVLLPAILAHVEQNVFGRRESIIEFAKQQSVQALQEAAAAGALRRQVFSSSSFSCLYV